MLSIQLFGAPQLTRDGHPLSIPRRKSRALLFYLAAHDTPITRVHLLGLLWPDHDRAAAQQILRTSLHGLRKTLGPALLATDESLALAPATDVDVRRFSALLSPPPYDPEALTTALALYRGDFLADFEVPDSAAFEEWVETTREHYRQLAIYSLKALAQQHEARHDYAPALAALDRALALNPLQEDIQRAAMRLHYLSGERAAAIRRYENLRRLLDDELGVPPMDETRALYDAIITDAASAQPVENTARPSPARSTGTPIAPATRSLRLNFSGGQLPFIGRELELQQLRTQAGKHKLLLIEGEPGIGKTRLADAFISEFSGLALIGAARELEQVLPYQPVIEALRSLLMHPDWPAIQATLDLPPIWLAEAARLLPELVVDGQVQDGALAPPAPNESRLWEGINQLLLGLAARQPLVLLLDDLHWSDASTMAMLGYLVRQTTAAPISFLATSRPVVPRSPLAALLQTLTREDRLLRLQLARLDSHDIITLAQRLSPTYSYPLAEWLMRNAEGNPYITAELVRYAREQGMLQPNGVLNLSALSATPVVPGAVYSLIQSRLARLSDEARRLLDVAVAVGREFELDLIARAAGLGEHTFLNSLDELREAGLVAPSDTLHFAFDHTLTMEVAYRDVGEARHRLMHRAVAEALEAIHSDDLDAVAGLLASHFAEGNLPERAAHYAFRAGQHAAGLAAWAEAISFYELALTGRDQSRREETLSALGEAHFHAGAPARAAETYQAASRLAEARGDRLRADQLRLRMGHALLAQSRYGEAIAIAQQVLATGNPETNLRAELLWGTTLSIEGVDLAGAAEHLRKAAGQCAAYPDPGVLSQIHFELGSIMAQRGDLEEAIARYREALAVAETSPSAVHYRVLANNNLAYHLLLLGDPHAGEYAEAALQLAQSSGLVSLQTYIFSTLGEIALADGNLETAEQRFNEGLALAERLPLPERIAGLTANLGLVARQRHQTTLAIHRLSTALAQADSLGTQQLATQIRIWLAPLLPQAQAHAMLAEARVIAEAGGRRLLLEAITRLEESIRNQP